MKLSYLGGEKFRMTGFLHKKVNKYNYLADCFQLFLAIIPAEKQDDYLAEFWNERIKSHIAEQKFSFDFKGLNLNNVPIDWSLLKDSCINTIHIDYCFTVLPDAIGNLTQLKRLTIKGDYIHSLPVSFRKLINLEHFHFSSYQGLLSDVKMNSQLSPQENIEILLTFIDNLTAIQSDSNIQKYISQIKKELYADKKDPNNAFDITRILEADTHNRSIIVGQEKINGDLDRHVLALVNTQINSLICILSASFLRQRHLLLTQNYFLANVVDIMVWDLKTGKLVEEHNGISTRKVEGNRNSDVIVLTNGSHFTKNIKISLGQAK